MTQITPQHAAPFHVLEYVFFTLLILSPAIVLIAVLLLQCLGETRGGGGDS
jgi:hypothetical protein